MKMECMPLDCTVVIALYNGEKFIIDQLESIHTQTYPSAEVLICDDSSSDRSVSLVEKFIAQNRLESSWKIIQNSENIGLINNFVNGVQQAKGSIVFFCDQDDIWDKHKLEHMIKALEENRDIAVLSSSEKLLDKNQRPKDTLYYRLFRRQKEGLSRISLPVQIRNAQGAGHTLAFRKEYFLQALPFIRAYNLTYDIGFTVYAASESKYAILNEVLVYRRMHESNTSTPHETFWTRLRAYGFIIKSKKVRLQIMQAAVHLEDKTTRKEQEQLDSAIQIYQDHIQHLEKKQFIGLVGDIFRFHPMIHPVTMAFDVVACVFSGRTYKNRKKSNHQNKNREEE